MSITVKRHKHFYGNSKISKDNSIKFLVLVLNFKLKPQIALSLRVYKMSERYKKSQQKVE